MEPGGEKERGKERVGSRNIFGFGAGYQPTCDTRYGLEVLMGKVKGQGVWDLSLHLRR